jgi:ABC-2 type transport system ATP-binding protein
VNPLDRIEMKEINMRFKNAQIFEEMSFECSKNEIVGITGENGSGKSVLFKLIAGFILPTSGTIVVDEVDITKSSCFPENLGVLIEEPSFLEDITGFENLKLLSKIKNEVSDTDLLKTLDQVGLMKQKDKKVKNYSLGMKKKLGIAQAIMENQKLILLDEPMNALDEESVEKMRELFKKLASEGATIVIASHNKEDIRTLCNKVYKIKNQRLEPVVL